eukprot:TRINITY_DN7261_c0_g1_i1.p1 TRINITY_DN7261_c0_g1~~TRINITY_DN7261_c0_g1_i1.p1  ORF type:complete len:247 (-),score=77.37 TRINITY_DN7261_c0_g1_i1:343-1083(-)
MRQLVVRSCLCWVTFCRAVSGFVLPASRMIAPVLAASLDPESVPALDGPLPPSLFESISRRDESGLRKYIAAGFDCNVADALGEPAVCHAALQGSAAMVKALVEAGANPNHGGFNGGDTPLMQAAARGYLDVVRYLVESAGVDINAVNHMGDTALAVACFWGQVPTVKYLLDSGADTQTYNDAGKLAGEEFDALFEAKGAADVRALLKDYRVRRGLFIEEEKNPLLWYLEEDELEGDGAQDPNGHQ